MTQLIAAICENREAIVLFSDRMVERAGLAFERGVKGKKIANNSMVLTAGTIHEPELIMDVRNEFIRTTNPYILDIAKRFAEKYHETRLNRILDQILKPLGFNSIDDFYSKHRILHDSVVSDLMNKIEQFQLNVHILLAGIDSEAHIYYICDPGTYSSYDEIGFFCPGMGKEQAESTFVWYDYSPEQKLSEALFIAFEAKKRAEAAGSVGKTTDGWIIDKEGCHVIAQETIDALQKIYEKRQEIFKRDRLGKEVEEIQINKKEMNY
jgi:hypothetical protein